MMGGIVGKQVIPMFPKVKLVPAIVYQVKLTLKVLTKIMDHVQSLLFSICPW